MDTEKKSGFDRRRQTSINVPIFVGNGNGTTFRQQEDRDCTFFVDQYSPVLFATIVAVLFVWVVDALLNYIY
jgi:hypothetical protein